MSCTVTETLNGEWELTLVHDIDERGKWTRLSEGCILRAPVPAAMTPSVDLVTQQYQTSTYDVQIYKITTKSGPLHLRSGSGTNYKILGKYKKGREVIVLNKTTSSWYEVTAPDGKHGYMASQYLTFQRTETQTVQTNVGFRNQVIEARQLRDQPFRIYRVVPELDKVTVYARHIFYDLLDNMLKSLKPSPSAVGASVVQSLSGACLSSHDFSLYSDLTSTAEDVEWENINPVEAMLGENGLVSKYGAELARDWYDVFLVRRVGNNTDVSIREKKNLSLTVGELIVKGADGCFYALSIAEDGTVTTEKKSVGDADIEDNSVSGGKLIEKTITARELNVASIFADEALVGAITAANIDVSSLFAAEAFIAQLNAVDISGNESLRLVVDAAKDEALDATGEAVAQIALTAEQIRSEVKRDYATADQVSQMNETLSTLAEQSENNFTWTVTKVNEIIEDAAANDSLTREQLNLIHTYMRFGEDGLTIGKAGNPLTFRVVNDRLAFYMNDTEVAYLSDNKLYVTQAEILARLQIGKFAYEPQSNGNLSVIYTG